MNRTHTNSRVSPAMAIIVYTDKAKNDYYLEQRAIEYDNGKYVFQSPIPLADNVLKDIAGSYVKNKGWRLEHDGIIPEHLLFGKSKIGVSAVVWYRPSMKRSLNFSSHLNIKGNHTVTVPATLYVVINNTLYVYALMTDERPKLSTKIYNAPFFNIYTDGRVCLGTAHVGQKTSSFEKEAERFERGFYMAEQNGGQSEHNCKTPLVKLWNQVIAKKSAFPSKAELVQHKNYKTLGELFSRLIGKSIGANIQNESNDEDDEEDI